MVNQHWVERSAKNFYVHDYNTGINLSQLLFLKRTRYTEILFL